MQTILALYIYGNETTVKAMAGVFMVVFGSAAYAYVRMKEDQEAQAAKAKQPAPGPSAGSYRPVAQAEVRPPRLALLLLFASRIHDCLVLFAAR